MERTTAIIRIEELRRILDDASRRYYVDNAPVLSDYDFDMLLKELEALEKEYPDLVTPDSPTQKVGSDLRTSGQTREFEQFPHRYPMLSLGNTYDMTEVEAFAERAEKGIGNSFSISCELKFDGTAICLTYRNGRNDRNYGSGLDGLWKRNFLWMYRTGRGAGCSYCIWTFGGSYGLYNRRYLWLPYQSRYYIGCVAFKANAR